METSNISKEFRMANVKITDLTALSAVDVASNDVPPIVDINVDQTKKLQSLIL